MTQAELKDHVWNIIDQECMELTLEEYADFLEELRDDATTRAEVVRNEIEHLEDRNNQYVNI